jgi:hypothetical protein
MSNRVFLNEDNLIEIEVIGNQNVASVELMGRQLDTLISQLKAAGKSPLVLDNLLQMGTVNPEARRLVVELGKRLAFDRCAMVGQGGILRFGANLMLRATGRADRIRFFTDRDEALRWLTEKPAA